MEQKSTLNSAALNGLLLALITLLIHAASSVLELTGAITYAIWAIKIVATNYALYYFMKQLTLQSETNITYGKSFSYGLLISLFSAVVCGAYYYIAFKFLFVDQVAILKEQSLQIFAQQNLGYEQEQALEKMFAKLPEFAGIIYIVYYTIWGAISSSIIANYTKSQETPFE